MIRKYWLDCRNSGEKWNGSESVVAFSFIYWSQREREREYNRDLKPIACSGVSVKIWIISEVGDILFFHGLEDEFKDKIKLLKITEQF
jgi:hypothetical protein